MLQPSLVFGLGGASTQIFLQMATLPCATSAREAVDAGAPLPPRYRRLLWFWVALGIPAFIALIVVFYLMVAKPA